MTDRDRLHAERKSTVLVVQDDQLDEQCQFLVYFRDQFSAFSASIPNRNCVENIAQSVHNLLEGTPVEGKDRRHRNSDEHVQKLGYSLRNQVEVITSEAKEHHWSQYDGGIVAKQNHVTVEQFWGTPKADSL